MEEEKDEKVEEKEKEDETEIQVDQCALVSTLSWAQLKLVIVVPVTRWSVSVQRSGVGVRGNTALYSGWWSLFFAGLIFTFLFTFIVLLYQQQSSDDL